MNSCIVIPARFKSSRFQGKPLAKIMGKEMIIHVAEACSKAISKNHIYIATDDTRIRDVVEQNKFNCLMTSSDHLTGTDRIGELTSKLDYQFFINVQGDEPLVNPKDIKKCIALKEANPSEVINGYSAIQSWEEFVSKNVPKVVMDNKEYLIYISRSPIPCAKEEDESIQGCKKQICIYGFSKSDLKFFTSFKSKDFLENREDIEILRFIENNRKVRMFECSGGSIAVDTKEDLEKVKVILSNK